MPSQNIWTSNFASLHVGFAPIIPAFRELPALEDFPDQSALSACALARGITTASGIPVKFIPAKPKPRGAARRRRKDEHDYELRIFERGEVSTRSHSWHDFFNALIWMTYPATKAALNARQIAARIPGIVRTREQDRLTMFDEGGVISLIEPTNKLVKHYIFGHAIFELICTNQLPVRGLQLSVPWCDLELGADNHSEIANLDRAVAKKIQNQVFQTAHPSVEIPAGSAYQAITTLPLDP